MRSNSVTALAGSRHTPIPHVLRPWHVFAVQMIVVSAACVMLRPAMAQAQGCALNVQPIAFGAYDVSSPSPLITNARLEIRCNQTTSFSIGIQSANAAHSGQFRSLRHSASGESLPYLLFQDASLTRVWGDGTRQPGRSIVASGTTNLFIYGAIAAGQDPAAGDYRDVLSIVVLP